ncbi:MAG: hypothetical protein M1813_007962 [Trichoglossum hirsutum]|nr:MAG: hypothetical protein M1813_007962 [Trichoglossum hirsutum]
MDILPQTFKDAVIVTRKLGKRYLWIDSLCIIQYGDNFEDWRREAKRMEAVFRGAYCTIAATFTVDSTKGLLRHPPVQQPRLQCIKVDSTSYGPVYISAIADDFHKDVEKGVLNQRAWVLQERALSRRIIHFTATQSYWECGDGVRCETLTYMRNSKALFFSDSPLPGVYKSTWPHAISGLEQRLATTFGTESRYGVFEKYLHRSLLWQRSGSNRMVPISYAKDVTVSSWSWTAYDGEFEYLEIESSDVEWNEGVMLADNSLKAHGTCIIKAKEGRGESGWLKYDGKPLMDLRELRCVIIGRERNETGLGKRYYVLVVAPRHSETGRVFTRVGVGFMPLELIRTRRGQVDECIV